MVARGPSPGDDPAGPRQLLRRLLERWRGLLERPVGAVRGTTPRALAHMADFLAAGTDFLGDPEGCSAAADTGTARRLLGTAVAAVAIGAALRVLWAVVTRGPAESAAIAAGLDAAWMAGRFLVFGLLGGLAPRVRTERLLTAWAGGLLPVALAIAGPLPTAAFALSAYLTFRGLAGATGDRRRAALMCGLAFGGQAVAAAVTWIVANGLIVVPLLGRG